MASVETAVVDGKLQTKVNRPIQIITGLNGQQTVDTPGSPSVDMYSSYHQYYLECPCCCATNGSDKVVITSREAIFRRDRGICGMPISLGAGYEAISVPLRTVQNWAVYSRNKCLCGWRHAVGLVSSGGVEARAMLKMGTDSDKFQADLRKMVAVSRGLEIDPRVRQFEGGDGCSWPCATSNIMVGPSGDISVTNTEVGSCVIEQATVGGYVQDLRYMSYKEAGTCAKVFCCHSNEIEVALKRNGTDDLVLSVPLRQVWVQDVHSAIMSAFRGSAAPDEVEIKKFETPMGTATITPGFLSLKTKPSPCGTCCEQSVTTTVLAKDVSYLWASLVPWQGHMLHTIRAIRVRPCCNMLCLMFTKDIFCSLLCDLNPFPFFRHLFRLIYLIFYGIYTFISGLLTCCCVVCKRKTEIQIGGTGESGLLRFTPTETPEVILKQMAAALEVATLTTFGRGTTLKLDGRSGPTTVVSVGGSGIGPVVAAATTGASKEVPLVTMAINPMMHSNVPSRRGSTTLPPIASLTEVTVVAEKLPEATLTTAAAVDTSSENNNIKGDGGASSSPTSSDASASVTVAAKAPAEEVMGSAPSLAASPSTFLPATTGSPDNTEAANVEVHAAAPEGKEERN